MGPAHSIIGRYTLINHGSHNQLLPSDKMRERIIKLEVQRLFIF
jgi:hypothetical protein